MYSIKITRFYHDKAQFDYWETYKLLQVFCPVVVMFADIKNQIEIISGTVTNSVR